MLLPLLQEPEGSSLFNFFFYPLPIPCNNEVMREGYIGISTVVSPLFFFSFFKIWNSWLTAFWKKNKTHKRLIGMLCNQTIPDNMVHIVQLKSIPFNLFLCFDLFALRTLLQTSVFQLVHWSWCASPHGLGAPYRSIIDYWSVAQWYHFLLAIARHPQSVLPSVWWGREREQKASLSCGWFMKRARI